MRQWKRSAWIIALLLLAWASYKLWQVSKPWQVPLTRQLEQEFQRLQKLGEPTKIEDLLPPVTPSRDGTLFYQLAIAQLDMAKKQLPYQVWDSVYQFIGIKPTKLFKLDDVQKALQASQLALQTFRKALSFPHMRMTDWSVENPMSVMFPHFSKFREFVRLLIAEGKWRKQKGDIEGSVESHMTILKLVRRMGDEPSLVIGFIVQGLIYTIACNGLQKVLSDADPSPQSYRSLMAELNSWDINRDFVRALQSERVYTFVVCDWMQRKASKKMLRRLFESEQPFKVNLAILLKPRSVLIAQNCLMLVNYQNELIAIARKGAPYDQKAIRQLQERWQREVENTVKRINLSGLELFWDEKVIAKMLTLDFSNLFLKVNYYHAVQRIAQTAIALRLYRHEHGRYPETLQQLVPKYLPSVPIDPFDGKPLRYKRLKQGFKIWSIGTNMKDEGGIEAKPEWIKGDIVWEAAK